MKHSDYEFKLCDQITQNSQEHSALTIHVTFSRLKLFYFPGDKLPNP